MAIACKATTLLGIPSQVRPLRHAPDSLGSDRPATVAASKTAIEGSTPPTLAKCAPVANLQWSTAYSSILNVATLPIHFHDQVVCFVSSHLSGHVIFLTSYSEWRIIKFRCYNDSISERRNQWRRPSVTIPIRAQLPDRLGSITGIFQARSGKTDRAFCFLRGLGTGLSPTILCSLKSE